MKDRVYPVPDDQKMLISFSINTWFTIMSGRRTYLIHHIDKGLHIFPKEATDRVTLILTREDHLDQVGEFIQCECAPDQTTAGWNN